MESNISFELTNKGMKLIGPLDETFLVTKIPQLHREHTVIDLSTLTSMNSCGVRDFLGWLENQNKVGTIEFINCPVFFVLQANMVGGIINPRRKISTLYVPYFDQIEDKEHHILISITDLVQGKAPAKENNGRLLQLDISEERYFQFLRLQG